MPASFLPENDLARAESGNPTGTVSLRLAALRDVGHALGSTLELDEVLQIVCQGVRRITDNIPSLSFILVTDQQNQFIEQELASFGDQVILTPSGGPLTGTLSEVVLRQNKLLVVEDYSTACRQYGFEPLTRPNLPQCYAWVGVPMQVTGRAIGVVVAGSLEPELHYSNEQVELLAAMASQAASAIENARLYRRTQRQAQQLASLNRIARIISSSLDVHEMPQLIMEQAQQLLDVEEGSLLLIDGPDDDLVFAYTTGPAGGRLLGTRISRTTGIAGYVLNTGRSEVVNNVREDRRFYGGTDAQSGFVTQSLLAVPLRGRTRVEGVIEVVNKRSGRPFDDEDRNLLEALADHAVIALENAQRFTRIDQALARRAQELTLSNNQLREILRIGNLLRVQHQLDELLDQIAQGVSQCTVFRTALISLVRHQSGTPPLLDHVSAAGIGIGVLQRLERPHLVEVERLLRPQLLLSESTYLLRSNDPAASLWGALCHSSEITFGRSDDLILCPLRNGSGELIGMLTVTVPQTSGPPSIEQIQSLEIFAGQAAVAIEGRQLLNALHKSRDRLVSIMASTREGMLMVDAEGRVVVTNTALRRLCGMETEPPPESMSLMAFLKGWRQRCGGIEGGWSLLQHGAEAVASRRSEQADGILELTGTHPLTIEWVALPVNAEDLSDSGVLLVLRDISVARETERLRQDLTNMIIHDLRSPLSSVIASLDLLSRGLAGELMPNQQVVLGIAQNSSHNMLNMVNMLLDISRLEGGSMPLNRTPTLLGPLIERAVQNLRPLADNRQIEIMSDLAADLPLIYADGDLIGRVCQNLIDNAIKFSGTGDVVRIAARLAYHSDRPVVKVSFQDQGIGIAPEHREKIFERFAQVGERRGGTGLGLTFCRLVIEAHNCRIWVESSTGKGSTFCFTLPLA